MIQEKELLKTVRHIALATVNKDGTPHNTPLFYALSHDLKHVYFASRESSLHSINFLRSGEAFVVIYDSNVFKGGLYLTVSNGRIASGFEIEQGLERYNKACADANNDALAPDFHTIEGGYKLFIGDVVKIEVYAGKEDKQGHVQIEQRKEVSLEELLA